MTAFDVIMLVLIILGFVLIALRGAGINFPPPRDIGWTGVAILVLVWIIDRVVT